MQMAGKIAQYYSGIRKFRARIADIETETDGDYGTTGVLR